MQLIFCSSAAEPLIKSEPLFSETFDAIQSGKFSLSPSGILSWITDILTSQIQELSYYLILFFCLAAISASVNLMGQSFKSKVSEASFFAC